MKKSYFFFIATAILCLSCKSEADSQNTTADLGSAAVENTTDNNANQSADDQSAVENNNNKDSETMDKKEDAMVLISTDKGDVKIKLYGDTPLHRDNFVKLAKEGYYDGLLFHRVIKDFMVQAGDPESKNAKPGQMLGAGDPGYTIPAEIKANHRHFPGAVAAARTADQVNPERRSSGSQFYIVTGDASFLDGQYTVFGEVVDGMNVVRAIEGAQTDRADRPVEDIRIISTKVIDE